MKTFDFDDYRRYLDARIKAEWGAITRVAKAANCQRSYLSRALKGEVLLTPDHLHGICEYWRLSEDETEYLMLLLEKARASSRSYRARVERKLSQILREQEDLTKRLHTPRIPTTERELLYYSAWHWIVIHLSTSIPSLQTEKAISQHLNLSPELVRFALDQLAEWELVKREGDRWKIASGNIHLPKNSPLIGQHHGHFRQKAVEDSLLPHGDGLHYSQLQAMEEETFREIKALFLRSIDESLKLADPAKEDRLIAVSLDVFRVY
jgi:transcriptional regulator with XRE-family HTH domain